jgi:hypothetical protein
MKHTGLVLTAVKANVNTIFTNTSKVVSVLLKLDN